MKTYEQLKGTGIPRFPANSRVCFLGDSLTQGSLWVQMIFDHYLKHCPKDNIRVYDCGVGQGTARFGLETLDSDLMTYEPTHVVIMYGANDVNIARGNPVERMNSFYNDLKLLAKELLSRGLTVYLMSEFRSELERGETVKRSEIANMAVQGVADELSLPCCDLYSAFSPLMTEDMLAPDGIHLSPIGDSVLARVFLHLQGFDGFTPDDDGFFDVFSPSYDLDHRMIFNNRIRTVWLAVRSITIKGETMQDKINYLYSRLETRADGAWDDFCYYRAVDFIERAPHMAFYREELDRTTEKMITDAVNGCK